MNEIQIPDVLQDYIVAINGGRMLFQKQEIPNELLVELEVFQKRYNQVLNEVPEKKLCLLPIEELWKYERIPVPEELKPYVIGGSIGLTATEDFRFVPPWLWCKLYKFRREERMLNKKKMEQKAKILRQYHHDF